MFCRWWLVFIFPEQDFIWHVHAINVLKRVISGLFVLKIIQWCIRSLFFLRICQPYIKDTHDSWEILLSLFLIWIYWTACSCYLVNLGRILECSFSKSESGSERRQPRSCQEMNLLRGAVSFTVYWLVRFLHFPSLSYFIQSSGNM